MVILLSEAVHGVVTAHPPVLDLAGGSHVTGSGSITCVPIPPAVSAKEGCCLCECGKGANVCPYSGKVELSIGPLAIPAWVAYLSCAPQITARQIAYCNQLAIQGVVTDYNFGIGWNWLGEPYLDDCGGVVTVVFGPCRTYTFDRVGGGYIPRFGAKQTLTDSGTGILRLTDTDGSTYDFNDFTQYSAPPGSFKRYTAPGGDMLEAQAYAHGRIQAVTRVNGSTTDAYVTAFVAGGVNDGLTASVTLQRTSSPATDIRRVVYDYYTGAVGDYGTAGDLKTVTEQAPDGAGGWVDLHTHYFRYYKPGEAHGFPHGLKLACGGEAFRRLSEATGGNPFTAPDATVKRFADHFFQYDADRRVTKSVNNGGLLTYLIAYADNPGETDDYNHWQRRTTITRPDGAQEVVYTNHIGQELLRELWDAAESRKWVWYNVYGTEDDFTAGLLLQQVNPSAVVGYVDDGGVDGRKLVVTLRPADGLIRVNDYYPQDATPTGGAAPGYLRYTNVKQGSGGSLIRLTETKYTSATAGGVTIYPASDSITYPEAGNTAVTQTTSFAYTYQSGTVQMKTHETTLPVVGTGQNGSGTADVRRELFDTFGNRTAAQDERGFIDTYAFDTAAGFMTQRVQDAPAPAGSGWTANPGTRLNLATDYSSDDPLGRVTQTLGPIHDAVVGGTSVSVRTATWAVYDDANDRTLSGSGYGSGAGYATYTLVDPVTIAYTDDDGRATQAIVSKRTMGSGKLSAADTFAQADWCRWSLDGYNDQRQRTSQTVYYRIPGSGTGAEGVNYDVTRFGYDAMDRQNLVRSPGGTYTQTVFDVRSPPEAVYVGTNNAGATDADPTGRMAAGNNMVQVSARQYDGGADGGDGYLTQATAFAGPSDMRVTNNGYDFRGRRTSEDGEVDFYAAYTYDNLDQVTQVDRRDTTAAGNLVGRKQTSFDDRRRVYRTKTFGVDPVTGTVGNVLQGDNWYDPAGNLVAAIAEGAGQYVYHKSAIDSVGRTAATYFGYNTAARSYANTTTINTDDVVFEQAETTYDDASNVLSTAAFQRLNDDTTSTGALITGNARVSYAAFWPDVVGRRIAAANYGAVAGFTRPSTPPARSDTVLVTSTDYNAAGEPFSKTDPKGIEGCRAWDHTGRPIQQVDDYGGLDRSTEWTYTPDGLIATLTAANSFTGDQVTTYTYGTTLADSGVARSDLLRYTDYPDSVNGSDRTATTYNRLRERATFTDQRGTVRMFERDRLGRLVHDRVTTVGSQTDHAVLRISRTYEVRGMLATVTSYDNATVGSGMVLDQVALAYTDFGQLVEERQEHAGVASGSSPAVEYAFDTGAAGSNQIRPTDLTYPDGRQVDYDHPGAGGGADDRLSRVASLKDGSTGLVSYTYLGAGVVVRIDYAEPQVRLDLWGGTTGTFAGLDRFGRVIDQWWRNYGTSTDLDRYQYGYDRNANPVWKQNPLTTGLDEFYTYDNLERLMSMQRGTLSGTKTGITGTPAKEQDWALDATGNWAGFVTKTSGTTDLDQARAHSPVNEIAAISEATGPAWVTPAYDAAGNTTAFPRPADPTSSFGAFYDAWNRVVQVDTAEAITKYRYDGRDRRIVRVAYTGGASAETRHYYYTAAWQLIEERIATSTTADRQYLWGGRYIDDLVFRDSLGSGLERLYAVSDAIFNVTGILDTDGNVAERFVYEPFGFSQTLAADWSTISDNHAWLHRFQGAPLDELTWLNHFRHREAHSGLGR